jgi:hypothetical protein
MKKKRLKLYEYKENQCASCGRGVEDCIARHGTYKLMFELHHVNPEDKHPNYNNLIRRKISTEQIDEVDKCVLLCNNCHNIIEVQKEKATLQISVEIAGREVLQKMKGNLILDYIDKHIKFISNERFWLRTCIIKTCFEKERLICELELRKGYLISDFLKNIKRHKKITVLSASNHSDLLIIEYKSPDHVDVHQKVDFSVLQFDPNETALKDEKRWIRNGYILSSKHDHDAVKEGWVKFTLTVEQVKELVSNREGVNMESKFTHYFDRSDFE